MKAFAGRSLRRSWARCAGSQAHPYVAFMKAFVRREGLRIASGDAEHTVVTLLAILLATHVHAELAPLAGIWARIDTGIAAADARLSALAKDYPGVTRLGYSSRLRRSWGGGRSCHRG